MVKRPRSVPPVKGEIFISASFGSKRVDDTTWTLYPNLILWVKDIRPNLLEILVASNNRVFLFVLYRYVRRSKRVMSMNLLSRNLNM